MSSLEHFEDGLTKKLSGAKGLCTTPFSTPNFVLFVYGALNFDALYGTCMIRLGDPSIHIRLYIMDMLCLMEERKQQQIRYLEKAYFIVFTLSTILL